MKHDKTWPAALLLAAMLTAGCGSDEDEQAPAATDPNATRVTLAGVVAKGALRNAVVRAHPVGADGSVDTGVTLAEALSNESGQYTLTFEGIANRPYVVRATPRPAGQTPATTQLDEISGETPVAAGFAVRALVVPATAGSVSAAAHVTPFSELVVAAAEKGSGGVNAGNAAQARANAAALLGFDPAAVTPTTIAGAAAGSNPQQLALATLLTAVSRLANDGALGCAQPTLAERSACVTAALSASATLASTKPGTVGGVDVAAALLGAVQAVVAANNLPPTAAAVVVANLQGPGTPPPAGISGDVQSGIAAARTLFTGLRSDWQALFAGGGGSAAGTEARKFSDALRAVQAPADVVLKDAGALLLGIDLYRDYMAGRTTANSRGRAATADYVAGGNVNGAGADRTALGCALYADTTNTVLAQAPAQVRSIGCQAIYFIGRQAVAGGSQYTLWRHGFTILPGSAAGTTPGSFGYTTRARRSVEVCTPGCVRTVNDALQADFYAGTIDITADAAQHITGFSIQGQLPGAFENGGTALVNERHSWSLSGTRTPGAVAGDESIALSATIASFGAGSAVPMGTLKITDARLGSVAVSRTAGGAVVRRGHPGAVADAGGELATADLPVEWTTPAASFTGRLELADHTWDASGTVHIPARIALSGRFRNIEGGVTTEFLDGAITVGATGYAQFDETLAPSETNRYGIGLQFGGSITAPGRPTLALTLATSAVAGQQPTTLTAQLRTMAGGSATQTVNLGLTRPPGGAATLSLDEVTSGLSLQYAEGAATATLRRGAAGTGTEIGTLTIGTRMMTFVDGSTMSLDFGP